jgi:hypothetical protein
LALGHMCFRSCHHILWREPPNPFLPPELRLVAAVLLVLSGGLLWRVSQYTDRNDAQLHQLHSHCTLPQQPLLQSVGTLASGKSFHPEEQTGLLCLCSLCAPMPSPTCAGNQWLPPSSGCPWLTPIIPATQEAETRGLLLSLRPVSIHREISST